MDRNTGEGLENVSVSVGDLATPIVCHMVVWAAERRHPLAPCHLWQVGELTLRSLRVRELSLPLTSSSTQEKRSPPHSTVELVLMM